MTESTHAPRPTARRRLLIVAAALALGSGLALAGAGLTLDDAGFDYADADQTTAALSLVRADGDLGVVLASGSGGVLPDVAVAVPEEGRTDLFGEVLDPTADELGEFAWITRAGDRVGFDAVHPDAALRTVVTAYVDALQRAGVGLEPTLATANLRSWDLTGELGEGRLVLTQQGRDVTAHLVLH